MSDLTPAAAASVIAAAIAEQIQDINQLNLTASLLNQIGDTLATIAATRTLQESQ